MGQFSWKAQDTGRSISSRYPQPVTMKDNKGNQWLETNYQGYGLFGGKDFYQLTAEMNADKLLKGNTLTGDVDHDRIIGINMYFGCVGYEAVKGLIFPSLNENPNKEWTGERPDDCPDQGWTNPDGETCYCENCGAEYEEEEGYDEFCSHQCHDDYYYEEDDDY